MQIFSKPGEPDSIRCDTIPALKLRGCEEIDIVFPDSSATLQRNGPGEKSQLDLKTVNLQLRKGTVCCETLDLVCLQLESQPGEESHDKMCEQTASDKEFTWAKVQFGKPDCGARDSMVRVMVQEAMGKAAGKEAKPEI